VSANRESTSLINQTFAEFLFFKLAAKVKKRRVGWSLFPVPIRHPVPTLTPQESLPILDVHAVFANRAPCRFLLAM